ncbi:MAG: hypothetical protein FJ276_23170 [Planctomycetes bacterium]|nr:hypothetical protein [Planctomycetota bacterium]
MEPLPKGRVVVVVPLDHRVMVPDPNRCVVPVIVFPLLSRSVVIEPLPKGRVVLRDPSERFVIVPDPNRCVVPVRDCLIELLGGSAASARTEAPTKATNSNSLTQLCMVPSRFVGRIIIRTPASHITLPLAAVFVEGSGDPRQHVMVCFQDVVNRSPESLRGIETEKGDDVHQGLIQLPEGKLE